MATPQGSTHTNVTMFLPQVVLFKASQTAFSDVYALTSQTWHNQ